jgi:P-type Cu+ transporter
MTNYAHKKIYTCPMHPEVRQESPGNCPKCGMALEEVVDTASEIRTEYVCPMHPYGHPILFKRLI